MLEEENYSSDTSDEDFIPEGAALDDDLHSESGDEVDESEEEEEETESQKGKKRKPNIKFKGNKKKRNKKKLQSEDVDPETNKETNCVEEAKKADSLWADFLADVDEKPAEVEKPKPQNSWASLLNPNKKKSASSDSTKGDTIPAFSKCKEKSTSVKDMPPDTSKVKITKVFEFAGEEVRVEEEVAADSIEAKLSKQVQNERENGQSSNSDVKKRPGLASVLSLIDNKKNKLSTLEKTKLDWVNFKSSEGLDDEMKTHLKSKGGYLEKQAFLERADLRQFEIERNMRMSRRSNR